MTQYLKFFLAFIFLIVLVPAAFAEQAFVISLTAMGGNVNFNNINLKDSSLSKQDSNSPYSIQLLNSNGGVISQHSPSIPEYGVAYISVPYDEKAVKLVLKKNGKQILDLSLTQFASTCNDGVCQPHESHLSCPEDCEEVVVQQPVVDNEIVDDDPKDPKQEIQVVYEPTPQVDDIKIDTTTSKTSLDMFPLILIIVAIIVAVLVAGGIAIYLHKKSKRKNIVAVLTQKLIGGAALSPLYDEMLRQGYNKKELDSIFLEALNQLITYINQNLHQGYQIEGIELALLNAGYSRDTIAWLIDHLIKKMPKRTL